MSLQPINLCLQSEAFVSFTMENIVYLFEHKYNIGKVFYFKNVPINMALTHEKKIKTNIVVNFKYLYDNSFNHFLKNEFKYYDLYNLFYFFEDGFTTKNRDFIRDKLYICNASSILNEQQLQLFQNKVNDFHNSIYVERNVFDKTIYKLNETIEKQQKMMDLLQDEINGLRTIIHQINPFIAK